MPFFSRLSNNHTINKTKLFAQRGHHQAHIMNAGQNKGSLRFANNKAPELFQVKPFRNFSPYSRELQRAYAASTRQDNFQCDCSTCEPFPEFTHYDYLYGEHFFGPAYDFKSKVWGPLSMIKNDEDDDLYCHVVAQTAINVLEDDDDDDDYQHISAQSTMEILEEDDNDYGHTSAQSAVDRLEEENDDGANPDLHARLNSPFSFLSFSSSSSSTEKYTPLSNAAKTPGRLLLQKGDDARFAGHRRTSSYVSTVSLSEQHSANDNLEWSHLENTAALYKDTQYNELFRHQIEAVWKTSYPPQISTTSLSTGLLTNTPCVSKLSLLPPKPGFAGQFNLDKYFDEAHRPEYPKAFGNRVHPNGVFTNAPLVSTPSCGLSTSQVGYAIETASDKAWEAGSDATAALRTPEEERLRTECYRECARAGLEGVPVGQYRYFHGHLTLEDYIENGLCVCWEGCLCTRVCTIYSDVVCPCNKHLQLKQD